MDVLRNDEITVAKPTAETSIDELTEIVAPEDQRPGA